jgi:aryl-alcohol dehydrogenase-like predicted oxidoreductase
MEYTHLGRTGLTVSRIGLGALKAAAPENLPGAHALMDRCWSTASTTWTLRTKVL